MVVVVVAVCGSGRWYHSMDDRRSMVASSTSLPLASINNTIESTSLPIAIVGCSFAGLTFAHVLHRRSIPYIIFDTKSPPYTYVSGGSKFNIPSYEFIANELDLDYSYQHNEPTRKDVIESLLCRMKSNLLTSRRIVKIECRGDDGNGGKFYLHTISTHNAEGKQYSESQQAGSTILYGPYQSVVGADGVYSTIRAAALPGTYLIGDARWVNDRWYDLGIQRIHRGADMALIDGYELGQAIVMKMSNVVGGNDSGGGVCDGSGDLNTKMDCKFSAYEISCQRIKRQLSIMVVFLAITWMKLFAALPTNWRNTTD